jgi:ABC-2 type transport system permease protein
MYMTYTVETEDLRKSYGSVPVLTGLDLGVEPGSVFALLGPNGPASSAGVLDWLGVLGLLLAFMAAVSWLAAAFGLLARSAESAGAFSFFVLFPPYLSSAFVPSETMPASLQWISEHQPVTPVTETLRALLLGTPGDDALVAVAWCLGFAAIGVVAAAALFRRRAG